MIGVNLDAVDREILASLTANARVSLVSLASKVHLSRNAVKQRIERMERDGVITGYTLTRGAGAGPQVTAIVMVYRKDRMRGADVTAELARIPEVARCEVMSGEFDLLVTIHADSIDRGTLGDERCRAMEDLVSREAGEASRNPKACTSATDDGIEISRCALCHRTAAPAPGSGGHDERLRSARRLLRGTHAPALREWMRCTCARKGIRAIDYPTGACQPSYPTSAAHGISTTRRPKPRPVLGQPGQVAMLLR